MDRNHRFLKQYKADSKHQLEEIKFSKAKEQLKEPPVVEGKQHRIEQKERRMMIVGIR